MKYSKGYKYQLEETYIHETGFKLPAPISNKWAGLYTDGKLIIFSGYAWNGASGPTIDTKSFMRGSLVHDALYQFMGEGLLPKTLFKDSADRLLQKICIEDGMNPLRAAYVYLGVKLFGGNAAEAPDLPPLEAP